MVDLVHGSSAESRIFLYAYNTPTPSGTPMPGSRSMRGLMDHRQMTTTQRYYNVGQERRREAVERVTTMQFDRHGTRIWPQAKLLLDSEHARRVVSEVAVPYGGCSKPSWRAGWTGRRLCESLARRRRKRLPAGCRRAAHDRRADRARGTAGSCWPGGILARFVA